MDLFKFKPVLKDAQLVQGEYINKMKSVMWVERYNTPGEFSITAKLSSGLREFLPLGTAISHVDTMEVMIVENHEIKEITSEDPDIVITGRSFISFLEQRIIGMILARTDSTVRDYVIPANFTWIQAVSLINDHIWSSTDDTDNIDVRAQHYITGTGESVDRVLDRGNVLERVLELLAVDDLGIRTIRQNSFAGYAGDPVFTVIAIYKGLDKSSSVIFSWKGGDLDTAEYLFSNKGDKNTALMVGRYIFRILDTGKSGYQKRMVIVDTSDLDGHLSAPPTGTALTDLYALMDTRGRQVLMAKNQITISQADISNVTKYQYRRDFNVGDLISLDGDFGQTAIMRVSEYAEIEDENGESGHPTLSSLPGA